MKKKSPKQVESETRRTLTGLVEKLSTALTPQEFWQLYDLLDTDAHGYVLEAFAEKAAQLFPEKF